MSARAGNHAPSQKLQLWLVGQLAGLLDRSCMRLAPRQRPLAYVFGLKWPTNSLSQSCDHLWCRIQSTPLVHREGTSALNCHIALALMYRQLRGVIQMVVSLCLARALTLSLCVRARAWGGGWQRKLLTNKRAAKQWTRLHTVVQCEPNNKWVYIRTVSVPNLELDFAVPLYVDNFVQDANPNTRWVVELPMLIGHIVINQRRHPIVCVANWNHFYAGFLCYSCFRLFLFGFSDFISPNPCLQVRHAFETASSREVDDGQVGAEGLVQGGETHPLHRFLGVGGKQRTPESAIQLLALLRWEFHVHALRLPRWHRFGDGCPVRLRCFDRACISGLRNWIRQNWRVLRGRV